ncbi:MAG TPA: DUF2127 domain-containing protein [Tepidisphaeraceae bacterium]|jgi:uncharacterized membrane protein (DUF2068 family)
MIQAAFNSSQPRRGEGLVRAIGLFKLVKSAFLIVAAISVFHLIHQDIGEVVLTWARRFHIAPGNRLLERLLDKALTVTRRQLIVAGAVLLAYAAMFLVEGIGLLLLLHWAEWMTVITTSGLIPFEIYEIIRNPTWLKALALLINIIMAVYLAVHVRRETRDARQQGSINPI